MNSFTKKIHSHTCTNCSNIISSEQINHCFKSINNIIFGNNDFCVVTSYVVSHLSGIFQVNCISIHSDSKSFNRLVTFLLCNCTDKRRIKSTGKKKTYFCISSKTFFNACNKLIMNISTYCFNIISNNLINGSNITITDKLALFYHRFRSSFLLRLRTPLYRQKIYHNKADVFR